MKRWNFRKADWQRICLLTGKSVERLSPPDTSNIEKAYEELCESLLFVAEQDILLSRRKNYVSCWGKVCETVHRSFLEPQGGLTLTEPPRPYFLKFDDKKQERWEEAVNSINFSHSNRKAWCTNNKLQKRTSSHIVIFK